MHPHLVLTCSAKMLSPLTTHNRSLIPVEHKTEAHKTKATVQDCSRLIMVTVKEKMRWGYNDYNIQQQYMW